MANAAVVHRRKEMRMLLYIFFRPKVSVHLIARSERPPPIIGRLSLTTRESTNAHTQMLNQWSTSASPIFEASVIRHMILFATPNPDRANKRKRYRIEPKKGTYRVQRWQRSQQRVNNEEDTAEKPTPKTKR